MVHGLLKLISNWFCNKQLRRDLSPADDDEEDERDDFEAAAAAASNSGRVGKERDNAPVTTTDIVQKVFICLYAFVDTKGADAIGSYLQINVSKSVRSRHVVVAS